MGLSRGIRLLGITQTDSPVNIEWLGSLVRDTCWGSTCVGSSASGPMLKFSSWRLPVGLCIGSHHCGSPGGDYLFRTT